MKRALQVMPSVVRAIVVWRGEVDRPSPNYQLIWGLIVVANVLWFTARNLLRRRGIKQAVFIGDLVNLWKVSTLEKDPGVRLGMRAIVCGIVGSILGAVVLL